MESFRILDLTDEKGYFCAKILADLGADVIKIEPPGGEQSRNIGPFYKDEPDPEKNLNWFAYNLNKKSVTLNIESDEGKEIFKKLVGISHFVIESFPNGYLDSIGLGYSVLSEINPGIILTSITPFGKTGPYKDFKGSDLTLMSMGGLAYLTGNPGESPLRMSFPQSYLLASADAAAATMIAHHYRQTSGQGQEVDVSIQASVAGKLANAVPTWELGNTIIKREGAFLFGRGAKLRMRLLWPCKDGHVTFNLMGGKLGAKSNETIAKWIIDAGMAPDFFKDIDWSSLDMTKQTQEGQDRLEDVFGKYFAMFTKAEIYTKAKEAGLLLCPQSSLKDIEENEQLQSRDFWVQVEHPELGESITYPGPFLKASATPITDMKRAPLIGEHNSEVYQDLLKLSDADLTNMKQAGII